MAGSYLDIPNKEPSRVGTKAEVDFLFTLYEACQATGTSPVNDKVDHVFLQAVDPEG